MGKQFAVLGLGSFGWSVALTLEKMGAEVLVIDESFEKIQEISEQVSYALRADVSEPEALELLGGRNLDGAVVAVSENFEASIMATMLCKEMGIPFVLAKAKDKLQGTILKKVGADSVVYPEIEMGSKIARNLLARDFSDWIELSDDYSMVEIAVPLPWKGRCLADLKVRERFGVNVVGVITGEEVNVNFGPLEPLPADGILIMIGANDILQKFDAKKPEGKKNERI